MAIACRRCLPYLKFVRGTGWERKHWTQLFVMLKLVTKVSAAACAALSRLQALPVHTSCSYLHCTRSQNSCIAPVPNDRQTRQNCISAMQGPDAVTYENLTLAHFLDKAERLAASANDIKALNAQV